MEQLSQEQNTDLPSLTKEELIEKINELNARIEELTTPPHNDWHSWFYILLNIVLHRFKKDKVKIDREVVLGAMPPRADFIVVEEGDIIDLGLDVFKFFKRFNIIEFKNPDDELSESILWKVVGYAGFYIDHFDARADDITLTLFRGAKPVKMFKELDGFVKPDKVKGIYRIENWKVDFPIQIVVTTELEGEEYAAFRAISKKPDMDDIKLIMEMTKQETDSDVKALLRQFLEMLSKLDSDTVEEMNRRKPEMAKTWRDIFGVDEEIENTTRTNLYLYVQNGTMTVDNAAKNAGISTEEFRSGMNNYINSQRQMQTV